MNSESKTLQLLSGSVISDILIMLNTSYFSYPVVCIGN